MSTMVNRIKRFYDKQLWTIDQVRNVVKTNTITLEEYKDITNEDYLVE